MSDFQSNPYAPPADLVAAVPRAGDIRCPWCQEKLRFLGVYLSMSSTIECPHCSRPSLRRKRGLPDHMSESVLMFLFLALVVAVYWTTGGRFVFAAIVVLYPVFGLADYLIDRRRLYLTKREVGSFDLSALD